VSSRPHA
jgi:hypothetical protein